ncbi:oligosaccharide repeat unit polymerase [Skermania sp. ID1734]|uniref:oligosaccharide repeat unit polymerase n=1 Tax=Skermania sp. ID1734 TaxID=2597516 RepID=UPI00117E65B2|nr:oligosaccharide repeat unit polymerase [Skermania sp. ID1734]TSE00420.1 oligosaccharide repeat unit polymerase [Skermania sp. ID1734]
MIGTAIAASRGVPTGTSTDRNALTGPLIAVWVGVILVAILPAIFIRFTPAPQDHTWIGALVVIAIAGCRYAWIVGEGRRRLIEMSFWVFVYVFLGVAPLVQLRMQQYPDTTPNIDPWLNGPAMVIVLVGLAAFALGMIAGTARWWNRPRRRVVRGLDRRRTLVLASLAIAFDTYFAAKVGLKAMVSNRQARLQATTAVWPEMSTYGIVTALSTMAVLVAFVALAKIWHDRSKHDWLILGVLIACAITLAIMLNPISSARYLFGTTALAVAAVLGLFATRQRFRVVAVLAIAALIVVFPLADAFRYTSDAQFKSGGPMETLTSADYDAFDQINNTVLYVERNGPTDGKQALGVLFFWVPRRVWPDKPNDTGILLADSRGYTFQNLSAPLWTELYINGRWLALVLGMFALGIVTRVQDKRIELTLDRTRAPSVLACILPFYLIILLRGSLLQAMSYLTVIVACALFVTRWKRGVASVA